MIELSTHIEYLLLTRDEVSVPQLGTFIVKEMSSRRVDEEGIFLPPYRTVTFHWNEQEAGDDFIASLSKMHNLPRQETRMMCLEYIDELQQTLEEEGTISFGSMGYLLRDAESGEIQFKPLPSGIASPTYYGLDAVPFAKLSHEVRQQRAKRQAAKKVRLTSIQADHDTITIRINRKAFNYATAVAASIVLFFAFASPIENTISNIGQKAAVFFAPKITSTPPTEVQAEPVAEPEQKEDNSTLDLQSSMNKPFAIVLASAISEKRAISFAAQLQEQGFNALACKTGIMIRVIIPGYDSEDEAYETIRECKEKCSDFSQAWPLRLKGEVKIHSPDHP